MLHDTITFCVFLGALALIVSPRVPTGVVPTLGIAVIGGAALWSMDDWAAPRDVLDAMLGGVAVTTVGILWRAHRVRNRKVRNRRADDWSAP